MATKPKKKAETGETEVLADISKNGKTYKISITRKDGEKLTVGLICAAIERIYRQLVA